MQKMPKNSGYAAKSQKLRTLSKNAVIAQLLFQGVWLLNKNNYQRGYLDECMMSFMRLREEGVKPTASRVSVSRLPCSTKCHRASSSGSVSCSLIPATHTTACKSVATELIFQCYVAQNLQQKNKACLIIITIALCLSSNTDFSTHTIA